MVRPVTDSSRMFDELTRNALRNVIN